MFLIIQLFLLHEISKHKKSEIFQILTMTEKYNTHTQNKLFKESLCQLTSMLLIIQLLLLHEIYIILKIRNHKYFRFWQND